MHFVTFSCFERKAYLRAAASRDIFVQSLEVMRARYGFFVMSYVVMPEHVHLLLTEPLGVPLAKALQALKISVAVKNAQRPFWQKRYYDFNVFSERKIIEKRRYIHRNPVTRGLVTSPELWDWSSFRHWSTGVEGPVEVESPWTARKRGGLPMRIDPRAGIL